MKPFATIIAGLLLCLGLAAAESNTLATPSPGNAKTKPATAQPAGKPDDASDRVIIEHADTMRYDPNTKIYHMRGNVVFSNKDVKLYCDEADYDERADSATARGHLRITDPNSVITGDLIEADFGKEIAVITGHVTILTQKRSNKTTGKPEVSLEKPVKGGARPSGAPANPTTDQATTATKPKTGDEPEKLEGYWERKTTITCERVEYYYNDKVKKMIATPRVKAVQEDKTVWADTAVFEDIPRLITLTGNVTLNTEKGDEMACLKAVISIDDDWIQAEGMHGATLRKHKGEEGKPAPTPAPPSGTPPATATPGPTTSPTPKPPAH
jgi:lipopolysaccharide assembly outer membrane protein LptD (OstA)